VSNEAPTDALRLVPDDQVRKLATQLASSIAGLGYPVGLGIAPPEDVCMKAAQGIFDLYLAAPASPLPGGGWLGAEHLSAAITRLTQVTAGDEIEAAYADFTFPGHTFRADVRAVLSALPAAPTGDA